MTGLPTKNLAGPFDTVSVSLCQRGYPACPDHTEKGPLFEILDAPTQAGIRLTESFAMYPGAAVSGFYFSHPDSTYFGIGRINRDQVEEYAKRKGESVQYVERWLAPILGY